MNVERLTEFVAALRHVRAQRQWKPERDIAHLKKRQRKRHLPANATMDIYDGVIRDLVYAGNSLVYRYPVEGRNFYAVRGRAFDREWLVIFDAYGVLETAFPPNNMDRYLQTPGFEYIGTIEELLP